MGANFICVTVPRCSLDESRKNHLLNLVDSLSDDEINEIAERRWGDVLLEPEENPDMNQADDIDPFNADLRHRVRSDLREAIESYNGLSELRSVGELFFEGHWWWITGGVTWGDPPTDSYQTIESISGNERFYDLLKEWAINDVSESRQVEGTGLYHTVFQIDVLSDQPCSEMDIDDVIHNGSQGDFSMQCSVVSAVQISRKDMFGRLQEHASDPSFLLGEEHGWKYGIKPGDEIVWTDPAGGEQRTIKISHITIVESGEDAGQDVAKITWNFPDGSGGGDLECFMRELS